MHREGDPRRFGRTAESRTRRCTATARSTGKRCGRCPTPGSSVCKFHGSTTPYSREAIARRLDIVDALMDGRPHPAVVFFELMQMRWRLSDDGEFIVCELPVEELGGSENLSWVHAWDKVMKFSKYHDTRYVEKREGVRQNNRDRDDRS